MNYQQIQGGSIGLSVGSPLRAQGEKVWIGDAVGAQQCQANAVPDIPNTLLARAVADINMRASRLQNLADRIQQATDRVFGLQVVGAQSPEKDAPPPHCDAERMSRCLQYLEAAIDRVDSLTSRIEQI